MSAIVRRTGRRAIVALVRDTTATLTTSATRQQANTQSILTQVIHKNMTLKHCASVVPILGRRGSAMASAKEHSYPSAEFVPESQRPLAVILSWLAAQEKHIEKYRGLWMQRGFDVLTVKMTPMQFLLPKMGSHVLVQDLIKFLYAISAHYPDLVLHCFSVGAYEFGEIMTHLKDEQFMRTIKRLDSNEDPRVSIERAIKGIVFDSAVALEGIPSGVSNSMSTNRQVVQALETAINAHLRVMYPVATKYYQVASDNVYANSLTDAPALVMYSNKDKIGSRTMNEKLIDRWTGNGISVSNHLFEDSNHVQHLTKYPQEYAAQIDKFLKTVPLTTLH